MKINQILCCLAVVALSYSCQQEEKLDPNRNIYGLGGEFISPNEIDEWLYEHMVVPYNIEVKYRWDVSEVDLNYTYVPVREDRVIPFVKATKKIWIEPYETLGGTVFFNTMSPKCFVLLGSPRYNSAGTYTTGEAEGGRKVTLFRLNWFDPKAPVKDTLQSILKTVHHEFGHILQQNVRPTSEFDKITSAAYTSSWNNRKADEALYLGFVSPYAGASPDEDFVEILARTLIYGKPWLEGQIAKAKAAWEDPAMRKDNELTYDPGAAIEQKYQIVKKYMKDVWNIGLEDNQDYPGSVGLITLVQNGLDDSLADGGN